MQNLRWAITLGFVFLGGCTVGELGGLTIGDKELSQAQLDPLEKELKDEDPIRNQVDPEGYLPVADAVRLGLIKNAPYRVRGRLYEPMSLEAAWNYEEEGLATWYGGELLNKNRRVSTALGEPFDPWAMTGAHKYLPIPINVEVTNLENNRSVVVRINDRGPFHRKGDPKANQYILDVTIGVARELDFHKSGTARVRVRTVPLNDVAQIGVHTDDGS